MRQLPIFVTLAGRPVALIGDGEAAEAKARLIRRAGGVVVPLADGAALARMARERPCLAFVALDDGAAAEAAATALRAQGLLVNVVDRPELCDFTTPAIVDRDPVLIAVGTGGASAGLAKAVRQRIEALLPARLGSLAAALAAARPAMRARWHTAAERRAAVDAALLPGGALDPLAPPADADKAVDAWLAAAADGAAAVQREQLIAIAIVSDDPDDLTLRAARLLGLADHVYHHPAIAPAVLDRARADAQRHCVETAPVSTAPGLSLWLHPAPAPTLR